MNELLKIGAQLLSQRLGLNLPPDTIAAALGQLLGAADGKAPDLAGLLGPLLESQRSSSIAASLFGTVVGASDDGASAISPRQLADTLGRDAVGQFAQTLGVSAPQATEGLAAVLPKLLQQAGGGDLAGLAEQALGGFLGGGKRS